MLVLSDYILIIDAEPRMNIWNYFHIKATDHPLCYKYQIALKLHYNYNNQTKTTKLFMIVYISI